MDSVESAVCHAFARRVRAAGFVGPVLTFGLTHD